MGHTVDIRSYNRIILVGSCGCGKSYLARELATMTGLPLTHLDVEFWKPGWIKTPRDKWIQRQNELTAPDRWIIDGNYNSTMELRFTAADLVIFPDINRFICLFGLLARHGKRRSDLPPYLEEKLDFGFFQLCKYVWNYQKEGKPTVMDLHARYPGKPFLHIKSRRKVNRLLREWKATARCTV